MLRPRLTILVVPIAGLFVALSAHASPGTLPLSVLPSFATPAPASMLRVRLPPPADVTAEDHGLLARISRELEKVRARSRSRLGDLAWRNPMVRDQARDRDATSFGLVHHHAKASGAGAALACSGLGATGIPVLGKLEKSMPLTVGPAMFLGGGGLVFKLPW